MITFLPKNIKYEPKPGETVLQAASSAGVDINGSCMGTGVCGKCKVRITKVKDTSNSETREYLACQTLAEDHMIIEVSESETIGERKKKLINLPSWFEPELVPADESMGDVYGAAVDVGTTTLVVLIWNLSKGELVDVYGRVNPQSAYGADVISRITFVRDNEAKLKKMQQLLIGAINEGVGKICKEQEINEDALKKYVVACNTTMSHLFLGVSPEALAVAPFEPTFTDAREIKISEIGLWGNSDAQVYLAANIAGHVGSDITAGIITTDIITTDITMPAKAHLFIDIGTNGEIVLGGKGQILACSTAAGPAFEGSSITQGMRAAKGAIERVNISYDEVEIETIGGATPVGICGSGIIDAVGELVHMGIVDRTGRILSAEELRDKNLGGNTFSEDVLKHLISHHGINDFLLYDGDFRHEPVILTQKDIREIQLAKAAISAGINVMMKELGLDPGDLDEISVAGAFGNYIRIESAVDMGLLPDIPKEKIHSIGNSAGAGASMMLLSPTWAQRSEATAKQIKHIELASQPGFQEEYMNAMTLGR